MFVLYSTITGIVLLNIILKIQIHKLISHKIDQKWQ